MPGDSGDPNASQVGSRKGSTSMTIDSLSEAESQSQTSKQALQSKVIEGGGEVGKRFSDFKTCVSSVSQMDLSPKRKIDKNAPKRPHSTYLFFAKENRQKVMMDNPEMKVPEINSILGARWRKLRDN